VGGSVAYNTKKTKPVLLNDDVLHRSILENDKQHDRSTEEGYIASKFDWTSKVATAFCHELKTDYALAEGGASGPTFRPEGMEKGFAVLSVAGATGTSSKQTKVLQQQLIRSPDNDREVNMRRFADAAAELLVEVIESGSNECLPETLPSAPSADDPVETKESARPNNILTLDRATTFRTDQSALEAMKPVAKYVVVKGNDMLFRSPTELALLSHEALTLKYDPNHCTLTFLGKCSDIERTPVFSIDVRDEDEDAEDTGFALENHETGEPYFYANVRTNAPLLGNALENEMALHAMAYAQWQRSSKHCPSCGSPLTLIHGGTTQICSNPGCKQLWWPRQDPSIIVSVSSLCGSKLLLARSHRHPPKMHTVLAGFVEAGESFEQAVARETHEEVGIRIDPDSVKYVASQPWPFPRSTMIAFEARADAEDQDLVVDESELVAARWFDKEEVLEASRVPGAIMDPEVARKALEDNPTLPLLIPPRQVVARKLIDHWLHGDSMPR